jgi:hypothetical protein
LTVRAWLRPGLVVAGWCALHATAAEPPPAPVPDAEFLEFLGNGDDADADLKQYLAKREHAVKPDDAKAAPTRGSEKP